MAWISRRKILLPLLVTAAGGPFLALEDGWKPDWLRNVSLGGMTQSTTAWPGMTSSPPNGGSYDLPVASLPGEHALSAAEQAERQALGPMAPRAEIQAGDWREFGNFFRFDLTPQQVLSSWDRVTTVLSDSHLEGLRVAMLSGSRLDDVAGSLTYYFDKQQQIQRITFRGTTGDPRRLTTFATETYQLQPQPTLDAGLFVAKWNGQPTSALRIVHAPVVRSDAAHARYEVQLEINRPYVPYRFRLSPENDQQLERARHTNRW